MTVVAKRRRIVLAVADEPALLGLRFYQQAFVLDPGANPLGAIMTHAGEALIGAR